MLTPVWWDSQAKLCVHGCRHLEREMLAGPVQAATERMVLSGRPLGFFSKCRSDIALKRQPKRFTVIEKKP